MTARPSAVLMGAAHRSGTAIGRALAGGGYNLALLSLARLTSRAAKLADLGVDAVAVRLVADPDAVVDEVIDAIGVPDILVHLSVSENATPWGGLDGWARQVIRCMRRPAPAVLVVEPHDRPVLERVIADLEGLGALVTVVDADLMTPDGVGAAVVAAIGSPGA